MSLDNTHVCIYKQDQSWGRQNGRTRWANEKEEGAGWTVSSTKGESLDYLFKTQTESSKFVSLKLMHKSRDGACDIRLKQAERLGFVTFKEVESLDFLTLKEADSLDFVTLKEAHSWAS